MMRSCATQNTRSVCVLSVRTRMQARTSAVEGVGVERATGLVGCGGQVVHDVHRTILAGFHQDRRCRHLRNSVNVICQPHTGHGLHEGVAMPGISHGCAYKRGS